MLKKLAMLGFTLISGLECQGVKITLEALLSAPDADRDRRGISSFGAPLGCPSMPILEFDIPSDDISRLGKQVQAFHSELNRQGGLDHMPVVQIDSLLQTDETVTGVTAGDSGSAHALLYAKMEAAVQVAFQPDARAGFSLPSLLEAKICPEEYTLKTGHPYKISGYVLTIPTGLCSITNLYLAYWIPHDHKPFYVYPVHTKKGRRPTGTRLTYEELFGMKAKLRPTT